MKKGLFVFLLMFCCSLSAMAKVYGLGDLSRCDDKMCEQSGNLANGISKVYYENGKLFVEASYKNGVREGISKGYYENGNLWTETLYKNDKKDGISKAYYENGKLKSEAIFKEGEAISGFIYNEETGEKREMSEKDLDFLMGRFRITGSSVKDKTRNFF